MKGEQANYIISLWTAFLFPPKTRIKKAIRQIKKFVWKHARSKNVALSTEVNEFLHKHSKNIPKKISATLLKEPERVMVFLEKGKELEIYLKKKDAKKEKKDEKSVKKEKAEDKQETAEQKQKLENKKAKEEAARAAEIKRKTA